MKKKLSLFVAIFSMVALISPSLALALEVEITPQGTIIFYQGAVLGDSDEKKEEKREEKREEKKEERKEEKREEKKVERQEIKRTSGSNKEIKVMPVKTEAVRKMEAQKYKVSVEERKKRSELETEAAKQEAEVKREQERFMQREEVETDDIKMQFPAPAEVRVEEKLEIETEVEGEREIEETERLERPSALDAKINEYQQKLLERRAEMKGKMLEIRNEVSDSKDELRMKSGEIKAKAQEGAGFVVDSETNEVRLVTPSGEEKVLNHLPDEAIQRMQEQGLLQAGQGVESSLEPTITAGEDGSLKYIVPVTKEKRLFGLFRRQVAAEVELDDTTGEVVEREQAPQTPLQRFLKIFEF